jgi:uncharacterized protein involved in exopolysaccharide biosynthesis
MSNIAEKKNPRGFEDFLIVLVKWRKILFWNTFIVTIGVLIFSLTLDNWYTSKASILPPKKKGGLFGDVAGFSTAIKDISKTLGRLGSTSDEAYNYLALLKSRSASERVIKKFDLRKVYEIDDDKPFEDVLKELDNNINFNVEDEGNVSISVQDKDPNRAAKMANFYVEILNEMSINLSTQEARNNRIFIEKRYNQLLLDISAVEDSMKYFSQKYNIYGIEEQTKAAISVAAELKSQIEINQIELDMMKISLEETHPIVIQKQLQVNSMKAKLKEMKFGDDISTTEFFIPFKEIPEVGIKYLRIRRDFEMQTKLMEFLLPIYEQAKIEEQKEIPVVLILDAAVPAEKKSSPKRSLIVLAAFLLSLFFSTSYVLIKNSFSEIKNQPERFQKLREGIIIPLKNTFRSKNKS